MIITGLVTGGGRSGEKRKMFKKLLLFPLYLLKWIFIIGVITLLACFCCLAIILFLALILEFIGVGIVNFIMETIGIGIIATLIAVCAIEDWWNKNG